MQNFTTEIKYSKRASRIILRVLPNRRLKVTAPNGVNESEVKKMILNNSNWILQKYKIIEDSAPVQKINFINGENLPFYGETLQLKVIDGARGVCREHNQLVVAVPLKISTSSDNNTMALYIQKALVKWYKVQALELIRQRVLHFSEKINVHPKSVSLKNYKSRWGACSSKGELFFNWQIIAFEKLLFDYVIAHEVCHLKELNHSPRFYGWLSELGFKKSEIREKMKKVRNLF